MTKSIGRAVSWNQIAKRSNGWGVKMNEQIIKFSVLMQGAAESRTDALPGSPADWDVYIHPTDDKIYVRAPAFNDGDNDHAAEWYTITPSVGLVMLVKDENKWYVYNNMSEWQMLWDPALSHRAIQREFSFYAPYRIRPNTIIFGYVATQEFTLEATPSGSGAFCEVAPTGGAVVFTIAAGGTTAGTITFADGATDGVVSIPVETVVLPTILENKYTSAKILTVRSPADTRGMQGLNCTLPGKIRSID